jgi:hypothetical protein
VTTFDDVPAARKRSPWLRWGVPFLVVGALTTGVIIWLNAAMGPVGGVAGTPPAPPVSIRGTLTLRDSFASSDGACVGKGGYADIRGGTQVTVYDGPRVAAVGSLSTGVVVGAWPGDCDFAFSVTVPRGPDFYSVEVSHRGRLNYSAGELEQALQLTLG